jgi:hypothetical protein
MAPSLAPVSKGLSESAAAYTRATHMPSTVAARLQEVDDQTEKHGKPIVAPRPVRKSRALPSPVLALRGNPAAARRAFVASLVFGAPKSLEE